MLEVSLASRFTMADEPATESSSPVWCSPLKNSLVQLDDRSQACFCGRGHHRFQVNVLVDEKLPSSRFASSVRNEATMLLSRLLEYSLHVCPWKSLQLAPEADHSSNRRGRAQVPQDASLLRTGLGLLTAKLRKRTRAEHVVIEKKLPTARPWCVAAYADGKRGQSPPRERKHATRAVGFFPQTGQARRDTVECMLGYGHSGTGFRHLTRTASSKKAWGDLLG